MVDFPPGWKRTPSHKRDSGAAFRKRDPNRGLGLRAITVDEALRTVREEATRMGATDLGVLYDPSGRQDPGVVVQFKLYGKGYAIACDRFSTVAANARAIALILEAKRRLQRYGAAELDREFQGYAALPGPDGSSARTPVLAGPATPHELLGLTPDAARDPKLVEAAFRVHALQHHPDRGGDAATFQRYVEARRRLLEAVP